MTKKHAKSLCCGNLIVKFGERRRQCRSCKKTWRIRKKQRGRKRLRVSSELVVRYFGHEIPSIRGLSSVRCESRRRLELRVRRSRDFFLSHTSFAPIPSKGSLICISDGFVFQSRRYWYTCYLILLRSVEGEDAAILPPVILSGTESQHGWKEAFNTIPCAVSSRIKALVCDGHRGLVNGAKRNSWLIQRCHFHLLASIGGRRSRSPYARHAAEGRRVHALAKEVLETDDETALPVLLRRIDDEALSTRSPELRRCLRAFVNRYEEYRTYRYHPELRLPGTNNTAESLAGCLSEFVHRTRGFSTIPSIKKWFSALAKWKQTIKCRPKHQPN